MTLQVNGAPHEAGEAQNIAELMASLGLAPRTVMVEHNGLALRPNEWTERALAEGDVVEVVRIVAGG